MKLLAVVFAVLLAACGSSTGVFINGHELTASEKAELDTLVGASVPAGRYAIDAAGNLGYEREQEKPPFEMHSGDSHVVSEGGCTILSTPSGSLSSGC